MQKESDTISLQLPFPFSRSIAVNYAKLDSDYIVILTGPRRTILQTCPFLTINGKLYRALPLEFQQAAVLMTGKYGAEHVAHYFAEKESNAYRIFPYYGKVGLAEAVRLAYDDIASKYLDELGVNGLQIEFRKKTARFLSSFLKPGMSVLEIGCSNAGEFKDAHLPGLHVEYHCVDVSPMALQRASSLSGIPASRFALWDYGIFQTEGKYDLIFSTFGALDTMTLKDIRAVLARNLKPGGILVGTVLNRLSIMDFIMSAISGNLVHAVNRINGNMDPESSRYPMHVFCRSPEQFVKDLGLEVLEFRGISLLKPPYNFERANSILSKFPGLDKMDELLSRKRFFSRFCEYTCFAARYGGNEFT